MSDRASIGNIVKLSIPIFFANLVIPLVAIVDTGLMGNLDNASYLTATSIATSVFSLIFWSFGFLRMGTVGIVAQAHGSKQYDEVVNLVFRNITFVVLISLLLILCQKYIFTISLSIFELSDDTTKYFKEYFDLRIYSSFGELTIYIITGLFIGLQRTTVSSVAVGFFSITNILLSLLFVVYFDLDVQGVALGTVISSTLTAIIFLSYTFFELQKLTSIKINVTKIFNVKKIQKLFNINFNIFIRSTLLTFSFLFFTYLGNTISEDVVAANTILLNMIMLSAFILDAYAFSTEGIVGYSIGSKNKKLLTNVIKNSFILSAATGLLISLIYLVGKNNFIFIMTDLPNIKNLSMSYSYWVVLIPFISSFCYQIDGIFIGASQTKELRNAMIVSVSIYILCALFLVSSFGNSGLWISLCIFFALRALTLFFYLGKIYKRIA
ncbi:MATE family efflux transporter [Alphaproteobacteria bacterium]|nr:MATE family efflux transporter [Alphaproteobacteria bacterium]MDC3269751.1 MATE family efflux transporter [Alphaproteobacteria bacterium]